MVRGKADGVFHGCQAVLGRLLAHISGADKHPLRQRGVGITATLTESNNILYYNRLERLAKLTTVLYTVATCNPAVGTVCLSERLGKICCQYLTILPLNSGGSRNRDIQCPPYFVPSFQFSPGSHIYLARSNRIGDCHFCFPPETPISRPARATAIPEDHS